MKYTAKQYAAALRASVPDLATCRRTHWDLASVFEHLDADSTVRAFFTDRAAPIARQEKVLHDVFQDSLSGRAYTLLKALLANRQMSLLGRVIAEIERIADREDRTAHVAVESAKPLPARLRAKLEEVLAAVTERRILATYAECPSLIGGLRVVIDGTSIWDASIAGRLQRLQERIRTAR